MISNISIARLLTFAALALGEGVVLAQVLAPHVDLSKLPTLSPGDISITNNNDAKFVLVVDGVGCPNRLVEVGVGESAHVRCPGASSVRANIFTILPDGTKLERSRLIPASTHYIIGVDNDKSFMLLDIRYRGP